jgi:hypothetical protein
MHFHIQFSTTQIWKSQLNGPHMYPFHFTHVHTQAYMLYLRHVVRPHFTATNSFRYRVNKKHIYGKYRNHYKDVTFIMQNVV